MQIQIILDWILRITGVVTLILTILSFFIDRKSYEENISIKRVNSRNEIDDISYFDEYVDTDLGHELTIFKPVGSSIKSVKLYSTKFINGKLLKDKCLYENSNLKPNEGVLFEVYYNEGIPNRILEWTADFGVRGEHVFSENGFNGNVDCFGYEYKYGFISRIRKMLRLR